MARFNLKRGRGDRKGALRLALTTFLFYNAFLPDGLLNTYIHPQRRHGGRGDGKYRGRHHSQRARLVAFTWRLGNRQYDRAGRTH